MGRTAPGDSTDQIAELAARYAALRRAVRSPGAEPSDVLDAAFTELEGAIDLLRASGAGAGTAPGRPAAESQQQGSDSAERSLLRAAFQDTPVPLFLLTRDGIVQRVNKAAGNMIGAKPGYATGRPFTAFVNLPSRAAVNSQLTAVARTGRPRRIRCSLLAADGLVPSELIIGTVGVRGEADPLMVAVRDAAARPAAARQSGAASEPGDVDPPGLGEVASGEVASGEVDSGEVDSAARLGAVQAVTRRLDLVTAVARLLLENEGFSEARTLQRCARLIAGALTTWVIVDLERRHRMRRQFVLGPDDVGLAELTSAIAAVDPPPGSVPCTVHESGRPALIAHAEDPGILGDGQDGEPLLVKMDATSVLSVPLADGENRYGALTLVRRPADGHFKVADLALVEELGEQMALAIRVDRTFRRRSDTADALHASLLPRRMPEIPGVEIAATYIAAAEDPEVGGDFYDVYRTPDGWGLAVGDVCGKGEEAAAVTAAARHAIRVLARRCADPGEVLAGTNEIVLAEEFTLDGGFVTANIAHLNWQDGKLRVVIGSAGHPAAILLHSDGRVRMMTGGGLPLGLFPDAEPATQELTMNAGDVLFLYTDGVAQARGADNTYFQDRLADELTGMTGYPAGQLVASMRQAMLDFSAGNLIDDVTMLVVRAGRLAKGSGSAAGTGPARKTSSPVG
ncbi:MAG TPA: SpoIIE family protein phosphatase [Streptosporangiaceae bacterium]|nr:SpoIIE family protein phosphatase [Streptosporangiaceae bacterium]